MAAEATTSETAQAISSNEPPRNGINSAAANNFRPVNTFSIENRASGASHNGSVGSSLDAGIGRRSSFGNGNQFNEKSQGSQFRGHSTRSYKDMAEVIKKLNNQTDQMQDRICQLYCQYSELALKSTFLFDPKTVQILRDDHPEIGGLPHPVETHFKRQDVDEAYSALCSQMPISQLSMDSNL